MSELKRYRASYIHLSIGGDPEVYFADSVDAEIELLKKRVERVEWNLYEAYSDGYISKYIFDRIIHADMKNERKEQEVLRKKLKLYAEYARLLDEDRTALLEDESGGDILLHTKRIGEIVDELNGLLLKDKER